MLIKTVPSINLNIWQPAMSKMIFMAQFLKDQQELMQQQIEEINKRLQKLSTEKKK